MNWKCRWFGHKSKDWEMVLDRFLSRQFDPSGIHWLHSHYRPYAQWPLIFQYYPERAAWKWKCECKRCGELIWEFNPTTLAGVVWGKPDEYEARVEALYFEKVYFGIDPMRT